MTGIFSSGTRHITMVALLIVASIVLMPRPGLAAEVVISDIRVGQHVDKTRFVLEISKSIGVRIFMLESPYRVVFDMPEVGWRLPARPLPGQTGLFKTMRYGLYQPGQSRVVVETTGPIAIKAAYFLPRSNDGIYRFVLDMQPVAVGSYKTSLNQLITVTPDGGGYSIGSQPRQKKAKVVTPVKLAKPPRINSAKRVIAIDPGHGGADPGTIGKSGAYEKHITLAVARTIKDVLEASGRYKVILTRKRDVYIRLRDRVSRARKGDADLFVSVHADAIKDHNIRGASVYTLSETASDKEAAMLAEKENKADLIGGMDLSGETPEITNILIDLAQRESMNKSVQFAANLVSNLRIVTKVLRKTHRFAGFAVLKAPDIPSVLVELGFLSNSKDEKNLRSAAFRSKVARAMLQTVDQYFSTAQQASTPN